MRGMLQVEPLYHQTIKGNKVQTRRSGGLDAVNENPDEWEKCGPLTLKTGELVAQYFVKKGPSLINHLNVDPVVCIPRYKIGEVLYLKEPTAKALNNNLTPNGFMYKFGVPDGFVANYFGRQIGSNTSVKWSNKLFMPASAARAFIRITGIKCERLLDISDQDCVAEGIFYHKNAGWENYDKKLNPRIHSYGSPKKSFISLFRFANKISPKKEINNPWVFCYTYEYLPNHKI